MQGNQLRPGYIIQHKSKLWRVIKKEDVKPGKGGAFAQVELKSILEGTKLNERFRADEDVTRAILEEEEYQFLYADGDIYHFMDMDKKHGNEPSYKQIELTAEFIGESCKFLKPDMRVTILSHDGELISIQLPQKATMTVIEAEPVIKGQTATGSYKPAVLENGKEIKVPPYIEAGDQIVVNIDECSFVERVKK